jgi:hypothetical protein
MIKLWRMRWVEYWRERKYIQDLVENLKESNCLEDLGIDGMIMIAI